METETNYDGCTFKRKNRGLEKKILVRLSMPLQSEVMMNIPNGEQTGMSRKFVMRDIFCY